MTDDLQVPEALREQVRDLPVLPAAASRLLTITGQAEVSVGEIARVIESDPTLMARTLRAANSPLCGTPRPVKTAQQATVLLGIEAIVNLAVGVSVAQVQAQLHAHLPFDAEAFGQHNVAVALATRKLARLTRHPSPGEAFVAGLLHDIGKLVLLVHAGEQYAAVLDRARRGEKPLHVLEREALVLDHAVAGYALCRHWNLPEAITEAVATHHTPAAPQALGSLVGAANDLVKILQLGFSGNRFIGAVPGQPGDPYSLDGLRALSAGMQAELPEAVEALGHAGGSYAPRPQAHPPRVQLHGADPPARALLTLMLGAMG